MVGEILTSGDLGRLGAYGANAPVGAHVPMYNPTTKNAYYVTPAQLVGAVQVAGPGSSTDNAIARFDSTTGAIIQNSTVTIADTTGLQTFTAVGGTIALKSGANGKCGTVTLNGVTPISVATTAFTANSVVIFTLKTVGGTVGAYPAIQTVTPSTGFTVAGTALDTSVYNWAIIETAA